MVGRDLLEEGLNGRIVTMIAGHRNADATPLGDFCGGLPNGARQWMIAVGHRSPGDVDGGTSCPEFERTALPDPPRRTSDDGDLTRQCADQRPGHRQLLRRPNPASRTTPTTSPSSTTDEPPSKAGQSPIGSHAGTPVRANAPHEARI